MLDLIAGKESARFAVDRLRIGLDLLDGRDGFASSGRT